MPTYYTIKAVKTLAQRGADWNIRIICTEGKHNKFYEAHGTGHNVKEIRHGRRGSDGRLVVGKDMVYLLKKIEKNLADKDYNYEIGTMTAAPAVTKTTKAVPKKAATPKAPVVVAPTPLAVAPEPEILTAAAREMALQAELAKQKAEEQELAKTKAGRKELLKRSMARRRQASDW